jgi:hypothetical protein
MRKLNEKAKEMRELERTEMRTITGGSSKYWEVRYENGKKVYIFHVKRG